jgi:hypothetical protein
VRRATRYAVPLDQRRSNSGSLAILAAIRRASSLVRDQRHGMRAMGGAVKLLSRCSSKSHRICQIRPSMKPTAIANEISKIISSAKVIGMFLSGPCH